MKSSGDGTVHQGLLNVLEKACTDESLRAALLQLTQPGCSCSEAQSCLVSLALINAVLLTSVFISSVLLKIVRQKRIVGAGSCSHKCCMKHFMLIMLTIVCVNITILKTFSIILPPRIF